MAAVFIYQYTYRFQNTVCIDSTQTTCAYSRESADSLLNI